LHSAAHLAPQILTDEDFAKIRELQLKKKLLPASSARADAAKARRGSLYLHLVLFVLRWMRCVWSL
jgi:hypothetical protein